MDRISYTSANNNFASRERLNISNTFSYQEPIHAGLKCTDWIHFGYIYNTSHRFQWLTTAFSHLAIATNYHLFTTCISVENIPKWLFFILHKFYNYNNSKNLKIILKINFFNNKNELFIWAMPNRLSYQLTKHDVCCSLKWVNDRLSAAV